MAQRRQEGSTPVQRMSNDTLRELLDRYRPHMQRLLPRHVKVERMYQVSLLGIQRTPRLLQCTPASLIGSLLQCSQMGLEPDGLTGMAYLVPYWNKNVSRYVCEVIPGYKGLMQLARRSGKVARFQAFPVYEGDEFDFRYGFAQTLDFKPTAKDRTNDKLGYAFALCYEEGEPKFYVSDRQEIDAARKRSKSPNDGPWVTDFPAMAMKTAVRRFCKFLPASTELATAVGLDELAETELPQGVELLAPELVEPGDVEERQAEAAQEQERAAQPRRGGPYPSDVYEFGQHEKKWTKTQVEDFVDLMSHKRVVELQRGEECARTIAQMRTAENPESPGKVPEDADVKLTDEPA